MTTEIIPENAGPIKTFVLAANLEPDEEADNIPPKYTLGSLAQELGVPHDQVENYWLWLGVPARHPDEVVYTDADKDSLLQLFELAESEQLDDASLGSLVRSVGHLAERLATWQFEAFIENTIKRDHIDDKTARQAVINAFPKLTPMLLKQFEHAWRWAATVIIRRYLAFDSAASESKSETQLLRLSTVGFADIVGFTSKTAALPAAELAKYVQEFQTKAQDIVNANGGRVVKTIGDAVMFMADQIADGANIALALAQSGLAPGGSAVRVGMVQGRILARFGDVFGPSVNLAARLTELAEPNTVLVNPATAALLASDERYQLLVMPEADIKGLGTLRPVQVNLVASA
jgi:adenylate cyclase